MKTTITTLALAALLAAGACSNDQNTSVAATDQQTTPAATAANQELTPEQLGELGAEIGKNPDDVKALLASRGLDEQKFEQAIRRIAENPDASKRYAESYRKKSA